MLQKAEDSSQLQKLQEELIEQKYAIVDRQSRFFVPTKETYTKINDPRSK